MNDNMMNDNMMKHTGMKDTGMKDTGMKDTGQGGQTAPSAVFWGRVCSLRRPP
jgi:hypothetical protein